MDENQRPLKTGSLGYRVVSGNDVTSSKPCSQGRDVIDDSVTKFVCQSVHTCQPSRVSLDCPGFCLFVPVSRFSSDCPGNRALVHDPAHDCMMCVIWKSLPAMAESSSSAARGDHSH